MTSSIKLINLNNLETHEARQLIYTDVGQKLGVNNCPSFYLGWCKQLEENEIDQTNFDQPPSSFKGRSRHRV